MIQLYDNNYDCCGCTACQSICPNQAITMKSDEEGFVYPCIDTSLCTECGLCKDVCAFQNGYDTSYNLDKPEVYAVKHKSGEVRKNSSSGGAFTAISDNILSKGGLIYGAAFDQNLCVVHQRMDTIEGRNKCCGSKYVQSEMLDTLNNINADLKNGRYVLFSGTGCQVAGLKSYLQIKGTKTDNLLTLDLICRGVPSPKVFSDFISFLEEKNNSKVVKYDFRSKIKGWRHTEQAVFKNGKKDHSSLPLRVNKALFYSSLCLRPSCYHCKYTNCSRPGDITLGDYWGVHNYFPEFVDALGVSVVIVNTQKGRVAYSQLNDIESRTSYIKDCIVRQERLVNPASMDDRRNKFWKDYLRHSFGFVVRKYTKYGNIRYRIKYILRYLKILDMIKKVLGRAKQC